MYYICVQKCEWQERKDGRHALYLCYPRIFPPPILRFFFFFWFLSFTVFLAAFANVFFIGACADGGIENPRGIFCLVCAPSLPLHCKYIMPQTHCNCTECRSSSLFLFFFLLLKAQELWGEKSTVRFCCSPVCSCRGIFFFACPLWWEHFTFSATQCWLSFFPSQSCLLLLLPPVHRESHPFVIFFFFPSHIFHLCGRGQESLEPPQFIHAYGGRRALAWIALAL